MQSGGFSAGSELELAREVQVALPKITFHGQPIVSCGALLEWLLAIELHTGDQSSTRAIRLCHLSWFERPSHGQAPRVVYRAQGGVALVSAGEGARLSPVLCLGEALAAEETTPLQLPVLAPLAQSGAELYATLAEHGLVVESAFRVLRGARFEGTQAEFSLERPAAEAQVGFIVGPSVLDAALHAALLVAHRQLPDVLVSWPSIDELRIAARSVGVSRLTVEVRARHESSVLLDVALWDAAGGEVARLAGVRAGTYDWQQRRCVSQLRALFRRIVRACVPLTELADDTSLAALGASSIDLVRIASQAQDWLGWSPQLAEFLATPTVSGLVELYRAAQSRGSEPAPKLVRTLAAIERNLWFLERLTNAAGSYNEGFAWHIQGPIIPDVLERALQLVQRRHPALCSYFPAEYGKPVRRLDWRQCSLELVPMPGYVRRSPELLQRWIEDSVRRPFDLEREPAFRCVLFSHAAHDATLVLTAHHMICDAWSLGRVLVPELSAAYDALLQGSAPALPSPVEELDRREATPEYAAEAAAYYRRELGDVPAVLDFPFDHPRPAQQTHHGACLRRALSAARWQALKALARELAISPFVLGLALYQVLLHRYTRQPEFCLGVPVSLRRGAADERAIGCLVNVGVIAARVDLARDLQQHCAAVRAAFVDMLRFEHFSLGEVVRAVSPERSLSHTPLVQAVFGYRERSGTELAFAGCTVTSEPVHNQCAKFDLSLAIDDHGETATLSLEYASDLLEASSAERLLGHFDHLLDEVLQKPQARLAELALSPRAERQLIAASEQGPAREVPAYALGAGSLADYADDAVVVRGARRELRGAELRIAVGQLSDALRARGVGGGELVALCLPRSPEWVIAALAVLDAGAAYAPFDLNQPRARIAQGIARCGARFVLTLSGAYQPEPGAAVSVLDLAAFERFEHATERKRAPLQRGAARPVYAIMTSGSTGQPRVAKVAYAGLCNLLAWYRDTLQLTPADRVVFATSVGFDLTQKNLLATLLAGAQLVIDEPEGLDPERLCALIQRSRATVLNCTPSLAYALVASAAARDLEQLRSLRVLVLGGEPIDWNALRAWTEHASCRARVINSYGPTECSDVVSACEWGGRGNEIGQPIPNARCRVVDCAGGVAALGVPGELWLSGTPLGLGYVADPEANAAKFVRERGHWYRTGDLVRRGPAGALTFLGRVDTQVKIRGYRIELDEIESALKSAGGVSDAAVVSRPDTRGRAALVGYVVPSSPVADSHELKLRLSRVLGQRLPTYMLPQTLCVVSQLPRTASGKLDRKALPAPRWDTGPERGAALPAQLDSLARIWSEVLGVAELGPDADFFALGGHSLAAVEVISRLERELGCRLRVAALFERPLLRDFAVLVSDQLRGEGDLERPVYGSAAGLRLV